MASSGVLYVPGGKFGAADLAAGLPLISQLVHA